MFKLGDIVRIKKEHVEPHEDPDTEYLVIEDNGDGKTRVWVHSGISSLGGYYYIWPSDIFYKVRSYRPQERKIKLWN